MAQGPWARLQGAQAPEGGIHACFVVPGLSKERLETVSGGDWVVAEAVSSKRVSGPVLAGNREKALV